MGCQTQGEINDIDALGVYKEDLLIAVELKKTLNLEVICQAVERQTKVDAVFIAIEGASGLKKQRRFKDISRLLKRLNVGLLSVDLKGETVRVLFLPNLPKDGKRFVKPQKTKREKLLKEFGQRTTDFNIGGVNRTSTMTAYRENALHIALDLNHKGVSSAKEMAVKGLTSKQISQVFQKNYYGWFQRVDHGKYQLTAKGLNAIDQYLEKLKDTDHAWCF